MEYSEFVLFPTLFHQQRESVLPAAQSRYDEIAPFFPPPETLRVEYWAQVVEHHALDNLDKVRALGGQHIWREEVLADRFEWGREKAIFALALRVYRLPIALELPMLREYGGCKSWVQVAHPVMPADSTPVLNDAAFAVKVNAFRQAINRSM